MAEYIDIDAQIVVTDTRGRKRETTVRHILEMNKGVYTAANVVERKKGTWWKAEDFEETSWFCSVCNSEFGSCEDFADFAKFCPECGAEMKGE